MIEKSRLTKKRMNLMLYGFNSDKISMIPSCKVTNRKITHFCAAFGIFCFFCVTFKAKTFSDLFCAHLTPNHIAHVQKFTESRKTLNYAN